MSAVNHVNTPIKFNLHTISVPFNQFVRTPDENINFYEWLIHLNTNTLLLLTFFGARQKSPEKQRKYKSNFYFCFSFVRIRPPISFAYPKASMSCTTIEPITRTHLLWLLERHHNDCINCVQQLKLTCRWHLNRHHHRCQCVH